MRNFPHTLAAVAVSFANLSLPAQQIQTQINPPERKSLSASQNFATGTAKLTFSPTTLGFGNVVVGTSKQLSAQIVASNGSVTIASKSMTSSEFTISGITLPMTLASGKSVPITLRFKPNASGQASGKFVLSSSAGSILGTELLSGTGVAPVAHSVALTWQGDITPVIGYNVYRGAQSAGPYSRINNALESSTNYTDYAVTAGASYYYAATAVNSRGQESNRSSPVHVAIPYP